MQYGVELVLQVRAGNVLQLADRLLEVVKAAHAVGHGRQLGNVQVGEFSPPICFQFPRYTSSQSPRHQLIDLLFRWS